VLADHGHLQSLSAHSGPLSHGQVQTPGSALP